jgi:hypothetical protein|tara:strand:+ start:3266 stop:3487 length:222 start_codon:yes stop_codon:yes gene_type:complete
MSNQQRMSASLADLLRNKTNGLHDCFTWFYSGDNWIDDIKQSGVQVQIEIVDRKDIRKTLTLDGTTRVTNYES